MNTQKTYRKPSEQQLPKMRPLSYPNLNKNMKKVRFKQHKNSTRHTKQKTNRTTTEASHWNDL